MASENVPPASGRCLAAESPFADEARAKIGREPGACHYWTREGPLKQEQDQDMIRMSQLARVVTVVPMRRNRSGESCARRSRAASSMCS